MSTLSMDVTGGASNSQTDLSGDSNSTPSLISPSTEATVATTLTLTTNLGITTEEASESSAITHTQLTTTPTFTAITHTQLTTTPTFTVTEGSLSTTNNITITSHSSTPQYTTSHTPGLTDEHTEESSSPFSTPSTSSTGALETSTPRNTLLTFAYTTVTSETTELSSESTVHTNTSIHVSTATGIAVGVSSGVVLLVIIISLVCFYRHRKRWIQKINAEQSKADLWAMSAYGNGLGNTIINDSFMDYRLASPTPPTRVESPASQFHGVRTTVQNPTPEIFTFDSVRRNTFSAPDNVISKHAQAMFYSDEHARTMSDYRGRASTVAAGRQQKRKVDEHVLLSHEEVFDDSIDPNIMRDQSVSTFTTEL